MLFMFFPAVTYLVRFHFHSPCKTKTGTLELPDSAEKPRRQPLGPKK